MIGEGASGRVVKAMQQATERVVAIKFLQPSFLQDDKSKERLIREAKLLCNVEHPNIVKVLSAGWDGDSPFIVSEYIEGMTLSAVLAQNGILPLDRFFRLFRQICQGLKYAHDSKIIHRDLKPSNIMITNTTDGEVIKLLDFGIAKSFDTPEGQNQDQQLTGTGNFVGSPIYMSPEQFIAGGPIDVRADIYALGCIAYECLTGRPPFEGEQIFELMYRKMHEKPTSLADCPSPQLIPEFFCQLIDVCLSQEPGQRPNSVDEILGSIDKHADTMSKVLPNSKTRGSGKRNKWLAPAVVAVVGVLFCVAGIYTQSQKQASDKTGTSTITETRPRPGRNKKLDIAEDRSPINMLKMAQRIVDSSPLPAMSELPVPIPPELSTKLATAKQYIEFAKKNIGSAKINPFGLQVYYVEAKYQRAIFSYTHRDEDFRKILDSGKKALTYATKDGSTYYRPAEAVFRLLGESYFYTERHHEEALKYFEKAAQINRTVEPSTHFEIQGNIATQPPDVVFYLRFQRSRCLTNMGRIKEGSIELRQALSDFIKPELDFELNSDVASAYGLLAQWYYVQGDKANQRKTVDEALAHIQQDEQRPRSRVDGAGYRALLCQSEIASGNEANAARMLDTAFSKYQPRSINDNTSTLGMLERAMESMEKLDAARKAKLVPSVEELRRRLELLKCKIAG